MTGASTWTSRCRATIDTNADGVADAWADIDGDGRPDRFVDRDGDGIRDGTTVDNIFVALFQGRSLLPLDLAMLGYLTAMAAISGSGGLTNTSISDYTRDQGWGMGQHVGAIPSMVGGREPPALARRDGLPITAESVRRFRRWYRHVLRDQLVVWMPACFLGIALPSMLSIQFLRRGTEVAESGVAAMTADRSRGGGGTDAGADLLVHDDLLRLPRPRAQRRDDGRRCSAPLGRRLLDGQRAPAPPGAGQDPLRLLRRAVRATRSSG